MLNEIDHKSTDVPVCPHCGNVEKDAYELLCGNKEYGDAWCGSCGESYRWSVYIRYIWTTHKGESR